MFANLGGLALSGANNYAGAYSAPAAPAAPSAPVAAQPAAPAGPAFGGTIVNQLVIQNGDVTSKLVRISANYDAKNLPDYIGTVPLTPNQQTLVGMTNGNANAQMDLARALNVVQTDTSPSLKHAANWWGGIVGSKPYPDEENTANGYCGAWVDFHYPLLPKPTSGVKFEKVSFDVNSGVWSYLGGGHNAIRIDFGNGNFGYLDNGAIGTNNIFFPEDIPKNELTNESPARRSYPNVK